MSTDLAVHPATNAPVCAGCQRPNDKAVAMGEFDAVSDPATHLPMTILRDLVGLGAHGKENMLDRAAASFRLMANPHERRAESLRKMGELAQFLSDPKMLSALNPDGWANRRATERGVKNTGEIDPTR